MNETVNTFLISRDTFIPQIHLREPRFTYITCGPFTKSKETIQKLKEPGNSRYIYQNELNKPCFQDDMAYADFKDSPSREASERIT